MSIHDPSFTSNRKEGISLHIKKGKGKKIKKKERGEGEQESRRQLLLIVIFFGARKSV